MTKDINLVKKITILALLALTPLLITACGTATTTSSDSPPAITPTTPAGSTKTIGTFSINSNKATAAIAENTTITITPPNATSYSYSLATTSSGGSVTLDNLIAAGSGSINISSYSTTTKTFLLKGATRGQVIGITVGITSPSGTGTATFNVTVQ